MYVREEAREQNDFAAMVLCNRDNPVTLEYLLDELIAEKEVIQNLRQFITLATPTKTHAVGSS